VGTLKLPAVNCRVILAVPTVVGLVESRKCVGSLLARVNVSLEGGAAPKLKLPFWTKLLPMTGPPTLSVGAVTVATVCTGMFAGVK